MAIAELVSSRSTCMRRYVGAVLVKEKRILATGYNGAPSGITHCEKVGCIREKMKIPSGERHELCRGLHAEQNAIIQAAYHGVSIKGSILYITCHPCSVCAKMIINAGIGEIIIKDTYPDKIAAELLNEAGVKIRVISQK
jgi:dCMP deaminase